MPLYDIDDNKVGQLKEFIQNLTPTNGGLMRIKRYNIGLDELSQIECFKDGLIFGIQQLDSQQDLSDYFWIQYDRNTRLDFRKIHGIDRYITALPEENMNETQLKDDQDAPPPEDDEAEKLRKEQEAEEKAKQEEERQNRLNQEYSSYRLDGSVGTLTYNNGSLITLLPNGYVMQSKNNIQRDLAQNPEAERLDDIEESRIVTSKSLIRYLVNGKIEIMYANGNFSQYDPSTDLWTVTNNQGKRRCKRQSDGYEYDIEPIPAAIETCAETNAKVLFKEDNVISVLYPNGTRYTVHHDGTKILTNSDQTEIVYEKIGCACIKVLSGRMLDEPEKIKNMDKSDADIEFYDSLLTSRTYLKDRVRDNQIIQTYLHDRTVIQSFVEVNEFGDPKQETEPFHDMEGNEDAKQTTEGQEHTEGAGTQEAQNTNHQEGFSFHAVHLIRRQDLSVTKITSEGEACIISGSTRAELNKYGNLMKIGRDIDYLHEMFEMRSQERKGGIFTCSLDKNNITTHDRDRNYFAVNSNGTFEKVLAPELSEVDAAEENPELMDIDTPQEDNQFDQDSHRDRGRTVIPKVDVNKSKSQLGNQLPVAPRLFWIKVDGSGSEFMTKEKMQETTGRFNHDVMIVKSTEFIGQNPVYMHTYFKQLKSNEEIDEEYSCIAELQSKKIKDCKSIDEIAIPKNVEEYSQMFRE